MAIFIPDTLWLAVAWSAAVDGGFSADASPLPVLPLAIFLPVIVGAPLLLLSRRVGQARDAMPANWLVALQPLGVFGSWALAAGLLRRRPAWSRCRRDRRRVDRPVRRAGGDRCGDRRDQGRRAAMVWDIFGLADFAVAITPGIATSGDRFRLIGPDVSSISAGAYPDVLSPAFVVPS